MIVRTIVFYSAAAATVCFAVRRGGRPEQATAALLTVAAIATTLLPGASVRSVVWSLFVVDLTLLVGLTAIALSADRFWPMYFSAVQLVTVGLHGVRAYDQTLLPAVYARLGGELAYPTLLILAIGTWRHHRRLPETDWIWQVRDESAKASYRG